MGEAESRLIARRLLCRIFSAMQALPQLLVEARGSAPQ